VSGVNRVVPLKSSQHAEVIVRAIIKNQNHVLLCRSVSEKHSYLPGGHIEVGETPEIALLREIDEELGVPLEIEKKLGVLENRWKEGGAWMHEINIIFIASSRELDMKNNPVACEKKLQFFWQPVSSLEKANFRPHNFMSHLSLWLRDTNKLHFLSLAGA